MAKKQTDIPGTERKTVKAVDTAAGKYLDVRNQGMALTKEEVKLRDALGDVMKKNGLSEYVFDGEEDEELRVEVVSSKEKVRVRRVKDDDDTATGAAE